jgi:arylsulfatase A-like enzyme
MRLTRLLYALAMLAASLAQAQEESPLVLVIVVDGLRPDYVTPDWMPTLHSLAERGVFFEQHHAAIPTVTRVNSPSLSTGSYPETHGLMGNSVYFPSVDAEKALNTSDYENLFKIREAEGKLLTATTIGEVLEASGKQFLAISSGSSGSSYLLNPELSGAGIINVDIILPESLRPRVEAVAGPVPEDSMPATPRVKWSIDAYLELGLKEIRPDVTFIWMTDPDHTAHSKGIGDPVMVESLRGVDEQIGRILEAHEQLGLTARMNIMVTADHGFSTNTGGINLALFLRQNGFASGVHVAGDAIYVNSNDPDRIEAIVALLREQETIGPIFTRGVQGDWATGSVPGTLSFESIHWQHDRSADILVFPAWGDAKNAYGFQGDTATGGVAGHGSTSRWDIHNTLIAAGPAFKSGVRSGVPSANPDVAPTALRILGIDPPATMTGRVLIEALVDGPDPNSVSVRRGVVPRTAPGTTRESRLSWAEVDGRRYIDSAGLATTEP